MWAIRDRRRAGSRRLGVCSMSSLSLLTGPAIREWSEHGTVASIYTARYKTKIDDYSGLGGPYALLWQGTDRLDNRMMYMNNVHEAAASDTGVLPIAIARLSGCLYIYI